MTPSVLITGGGTGIGAAVARRMAADGWSVGVAGRRPEPLAAVAAEIGAVAIAGDVSVPSGARQAVGTCLEHYGRLDALVISSGAGSGGAVLDQSSSAGTVLQTNLTGAFLLCQAALEPLSAGGGAIVAVGSLAGLRADPESAAYCSSKAGLIMLTQCIALDYGPLGVRANCVCPGWIRTDMADAAMDELAASHSLDREEAYALAVAASRRAAPGGGGGGRGDRLAGVAGGLLRQRSGADRRWRRVGGRRRYAGVRTAPAGGWSCWK